MKIKGKEKLNYLRDLGTNRRGLIKCNNKNIVSLKIPVHDLAPMEVFHTLGTVKDKSQLHNELHVGVFLDVAVETPLGNILGNKTHTSRECDSSNKLK